MTSFQIALLLSLLAGLSIPVGGALATVSAIHPRWLSSDTRHAIMAFGGGALVSAVALVLVPEGAESLSVGGAALSFGAGGLAFYQLERFLDRSGGSIAQLVAMLSDFVPEAIALGAALAVEEKSGALLAAMIALQNLPEGFNAQRELGERNPVALRKPWLFLPLVLIGPLAATAGFHVFADHPRALGVVMLSASGGILYIVFQDIAPAAHRKRRGAPALGAVLGFLLGLIGFMIVD